MLAGIPEPTADSEPERERDERGRYLPKRKTPSFDGGARMTPLLCVTHEQTLMEIIEADAAPVAARSPDRRLS